MTSQESEFDAVIGVDLGDGETTLATCRTSEQSSPDILVVGGAEKLLTCIAYDSDGSILLGEDARNSTTAQEIFVTFKTRPSFDKAGAGQLSGQFVRELLSRAGGEHGLDFKRIKLVVGHPSAWSYSDVESYVATIKGQENWDLSGVAESRAAFLQLKESGRLTTAQLSQATLIVDIGSSTTDFTVVENLRQQPVEFGANSLGGRLIDRLVVDLNVKRMDDSEKVRQILDENPHVYAKCEGICREIKERCFSNNAPKDEVVRLDHSRLFLPTVDMEQMEQLLHIPCRELDGLSWSDAYTDALSDVKKRCEESGIKPKTIAFTGGASRMRFTRDVCSKLFPEADIVIDESPQFCIARGLARAGRWQLRQNTFQDELAPVSNDIRRALESTFDEFLQAFLPQLSQNFINQVVRPSLLDWREGRLATLNDIGPRIESRSGTWGESNDLKDLVEPALVKWADRGIQQITPQLEAICARYGLPTDALAVRRVGVGIDGRNVTTGSMATLDEGVLFTSSVTAGVAGAIAFKVALVVKGIIIAMVLKGGAVAAALTGPVGWAVAAGAAPPNFVFGKAKIEEFVKSQVIPKTIRPVILTDARIAKCTQDVSNEVLTSLRKDLQESKKHELVRDTSNELRAELEKRMNEALILIQS